MSVFYVCMTVFVIEVPCGSSSSCYIEEVRQAILLYCLKSCIFPQTVWLKIKIVTSPLETLSSNWRIQIQPPCVRGCEKQIPNNLFINGEQVKISRV